MPTFFLTECPGMQTSIQGSDTVGNTTTATVFGSSYTWGASSFSVVGRAGRIEAWGTYSTDLVVGHSVSLEVLIGTTTLLTTGSVSLTLAGATNKGWRLEGTWATRTAGTAGVLEAQGLASFAGSALTPDVAFMTNTAGITTDLTQAQPISVRVQWGTADSDNTATMRLMTQEIMGTS